MAFSCKVASLRLDTNRPRCRGRGNWLCRTAMPRAEWMFMLTIAAPIVQASGPNRRKSFELAGTYRSLA